MSTIFYKITRLAVISCMVIVLGAGACATRPDMIIPVPYSGYAVADLSCDELTTRISVRNLELQTLFEIQRSIRASDRGMGAIAIALGVVLFPALGFLGFLTKGDGATAERIAVLKGEVMELYRAFNYSCISPMAGDAEN